jgi:hypothetical protein
VTVALATPDTSEPWQGGGLRLGRHTAFAHIIPGDAAAAAACRRWGRATSPGKEEARTAAQTYPPTA